MDSRESPICRVQMPNPPSSEARAGLFADGDPFAFGRLSSVGSLGRAVSPRTSPPAEYLQGAETGSLFGTESVGREGLLHYSTILLRSCLIETELDCSATHGRADAS